MVLALFNPITSCLLIFFKTLFALISEGAIGVNSVRSYFPRDTFVS